MATLDLFTVEINHRQVMLRFEIYWRCFMISMCFALADDFTSNYGCFCFWNVFFLVLFPKLKC